MAKRIYTPKQLSPEIVRESEISRAGTLLDQAKKALADRENFLAKAHATGRVLPNGEIAGANGPYGGQLTVEVVEAQIANNAADYERALAEWNAVQAKYSV